MLKKFYRTFSITASMIKAGLLSPSIFPPFLTLKDGLIITGNTDDGSTLALAIYDKNGVLVGKIDTRGFQRIEYKDEYVAGEWLTPQGATAPDLVTVTLQGIPYRVYSFDGNITAETITNSFEINHDVDCAGLNTEIVKLEWHVHFMPSTTGSGNIKFFLDYTYLPLNGVAIAQNSLSFVQAVDNQQYVHLVKGVELPVPAGGFHIGDMILFTLRRTPTDQEDTYNADVLFLKTALHVPVNSRGSRLRYIK